MQTFTDDASAQQRKLIDVNDLSHFKKGERNQTNPTVSIEKCPAA